MADDEFSDLDECDSYEENENLKEEENYEDEKETIGESGYSSSNRDCSRRLSRDSPPPQSTGSRALPRIDEEHSFDLRSRGPSFERQPLQTAFPRKVEEAQSKQDEFSMQNDTFQGDDDFGSFRSDALQAIEEEDRKHELSDKFNIPEGVPLNLRKENSWEPSILNGSSPVAHEAPRSRSILVERNRTPQQSPMKTNKNEISMRESPRRQANITNVGDASASFADSHFQSTPVAKRSSNGSSRVRKARDIFQENFFTGTDDSLQPSMILPGADESRMSKNMAPLSRAESVNNMTDSSSVVPSNSMIHEAIGASANASTFIAKIKAKREQRKADRSAKLSAIAPMLSKVDNVQGLERQLVHGSTSSLGSRPVSQASTVSRSINSHRVKEGTSALSCIRILSFGYAAVGDRVLRELEIENTTDGALSVGIHMLDNHAAEVFSMESNQIQIPPKTKYALKVFFNASKENQFYQCQLELKAINIVYKRRVDLQGFSGVACVEPLPECGLQTTKQGNNILKTSNHSTVEVKFANKGTRTAYVLLKTLSRFHDDVEEPNVVIEPSSRFLLSPKDKITVRLHSSSAPIGDFRLRVYWGEFGQKQRYKAYTKARGKEEKLYDNISFIGATFKGEDILDGQDEQKLQKCVHYGDQKNFFESIRVEDIPVVNRRNTGSRQSLNDDTDCSLYTTAMGEMTLRRGESVIDDRTRRFVNTSRFSSK
ncbi:hypothetical protein QR680_008514 [Steinernema hermaphroditum]|uniref:Abnormal spindle-like microcephaly-associated protein ASH domain-containing protein n=1 Tax=Steinernema hermaphroditum TaxID=289476 RepID=A0AA39IGW9_9BILA|nr:hypothetical protein QR680_008514 [Steinernema hermaphroditum]